MIAPFSVLLGQDDCSIAGMHGFDARRYFTPAARNQTLDWIAKGSPLFETMRVLPSA
jgi:hypothetical protein